MLSAGLPVATHAAQRILGVRYWEQETLRRQTYFAGYDSGTTTSWDAIRDILAIKHRERLEEEERQRTEGDGGGTKPPGREKTARKN